LDEVATGLPVGFLQPFESRKGAEKGTGYFLLALFILDRTRGSLRRRRRGKVDHSTFRILWRGTA
jgi:hypothetical protein